MLKTLVSVDALRTGVDVEVELETWLVLTVPKLVVRLRTTQSVRM